MLNMKHLRQQRSETQAEVAQALGISERNYKRIENGKNRPRLNTAWSLEEHYGQSIKFLLETHDYSVTSISPM